MPPGVKAEVAALTLPLVPTMSIASQDAPLIGTEVPLTVAWQLLNVIKAEVGQRVNARIAARRLRDPLGAVAVGREGGGDGHRQIAGVVL